MSRIKGNFFFPNLKKMIQTYKEYQCKYASFGEKYIKLLFEKYCIQHDINSYYDQFSIQICNIISKYLCISCQILNQSVGQLFFKQQKHPCFQYIQQIEAQIALIAIIYNHQIILQTLQKISDHQFIVKPNQLPSLENGQFLKEQLCSMEKWQNQQQKIKKQKVEKIQKQLINDQFQLFEKNIVCMRIQMNCFTQKLHLNPVKFESNKSGKSWQVDALMVLKHIYTQNQQIIIMKQAQATNKKLAMTQCCREIFRTIFNTFPNIMMFYLNK